MCRKEAYQTRVVHEGVGHLRDKMAIMYATVVFYLLKYRLIVWIPTFPPEFVVG